MLLKPDLPLDSDETLLSYADRLSLMHTGRGMERLLKDLKINREQFVSGRPDAFASLAEAAGHEIECFERNSIRVFQRGASFRGEDIAKAFLSPRAAWYCPLCLVADGPCQNRRFRLIWGFRHVVRCERHVVWLLGAPDPSATNLRLSMCGEHVGAAVDADGGMPEYLAWLSCHLRGQQVLEFPWLNGQTVAQILDASEMLGAILEHGHKVKPSKLTPAEIEEATDIGFTIYREGPAAIDEALDTIRKSSPATAVQAGPLAYYGQLFDWLDRRSNALDAGPIRAILRDHIVKHSAVEPGTKVLGVTITERRFHTVKSLARDVRIDRERLARLLKKLDLVQQGATEVEIGNMVFEAAITLPLIRAFQTAVPLQDVSEYLGASKRQVEIMYRVGIVKPLIPRTGRGSVRQVIFSRAHLDDLLAAVSNLPIVDVAADRDLHPIAYAAQRGAGRFEDLFSGVLDGTIQAYRRPEQIGIGSIQLDVNALISQKKIA